MIKKQERKNWVFTEQSFETHNFINITQLIFGGKPLKTGWLTVKYKNVVLLSIDLHKGILNYCLHYGYIVLLLKIYV